MTALEIIKAIREDENCTSDLDVYLALEDGEYLARIGATDADRDAVEEAFSLFMSSKAI